MILDFITNNYKKTTDSVYLINAESIVLTIEQMNYILLIEKPIELNIYVEENKSIMESVLKEREAAFLKSFLGDSPSLKIFNRIQIEDWVGFSFFKN
jgi:hypothetical protein